MKRFGGALWAVGASWSVKGVSVHISFYSRCVFVGSMDGGDLQ